MPPQPHVPTPTELDIDRLVRRDYSGGQREAVLRIVQTFQSAAPADRACRLSAAALKLSTGNIDRLCQYLQQAQFDPIELLRRAESPGYRQIEVRIRNRGLPRELQERIIAEDRELYEAWLWG
jgi:hypothetical protein